MNRNKVQIEIDVDTLKGIRNVRALQQELASTLKEVDELKKAKDKLEKKEKNYTGNKTDPKYLLLRKEAEEAREAFDKASLSVSNYNAEIDRQVKKLGLAGLTNKELNSYLREQRRLYDNNLRGSEEYQKAVENLQKAEAELAQRRADKKGAVSFFDNAKSNLSAAVVGGIAGGLASAGLGIVTSMLEGVFSKISEKIDNAFAKSDKISSIKNAIKGTTDEAIRLNTEIGKLDTRLEQATRQEILIEAGKLDVPTNQIVAYTKSVSDATLAMKEDFPEGAGQIVQDFTKIKSLFKDTKELDYPTSINQIGSAMKGLADEGTATAKWQAEFLMRLGQLDEKLRPTITDLMGLGAALEESGLTDEIAASGVQSILATAYKNTELFAKFFGQSKKQFEEFINLDPNGFLLEFSKRLQPLTATQEMQTLKNLKIESQEANKVLGVLGNKFDDIVQKQTKSLTYFGEGIRMTQIANELNNNLAGKWERFTNRVADLASNSKVSLFFSGFINDLVDIGLALTDNTTKLEKLKNQFQTQSSVVNRLDKDYTPLLEKYKALIANTKDAAKNQSEIERIVKVLSEVLPANTIQWNKNGQAIGINTTKAQEYIEVQKAMLKVQNASLIAEIQSEKNKEQLNLQRLRRLSKGQWTGKVAESYYRQDSLTFGDAFGSMAGAKGFGFNTKGLINVEQYKKLMEELNKSEAKVQDYEKALKGFSGEILQTQASEKKVFEYTDAELDSFIKKQKKSVDKLDKGSNQYKEALKKLNELKQEYRNRHPTIIDPNDDKANKKAQKDTAEFLSNEERLLYDAMMKRLNMIEDETQRKNAILEAEFQNEVKQYKKLLAEKKVSQETYDKWYEANRAFTDFQIAQNEKQNNEKLAEKVQETNQKALLRKLELHKEELEAELEQAKANGDLKAIYEAEINLNLAEQEIELAKATADEKIKIEETFRKKRLAIHDKWLADRESKDQKDRATEWDQKQELIKKEEERRKELYAKIANWQRAISDITSAFFDFQSQQIANEQTREDNLYNKKIQNLEAQKNKGVITEAEYNKKKLSFEQEHDKKSREIKNKAAQADKVARIAQAVMTAAQAVLAGLSAPFPFNTVLPIVAATVGAIQVAKIASTEIPQYYDGDWTHRSSGPGMDGRGGQLAMVHPNEFVMNAKATSNPAFPAVLPILKTLNQGKTPSVSGGQNQNTTTSIEIKQDHSELVNAVQKLVEILPNISATVQWGYRENQEFDRNRKKYTQSNEDSYIQ
ncbi:MAG: phage tail tape measure protein [Dolichospermum sp.]